MTQEAPAPDEKDDPFWQEAIKRAWAVPDRPLGVDDLKTLLHAALLHGAKMGLAAQQVPDTLKDSSEFDELRRAMIRETGCTTPSMQTALLRGVTQVVTAFRRITIVTRSTSNITVGDLARAKEEMRLQGQKEILDEFKKLGVEYGDEERLHLQRAGVARSEKNKLRDIVSKLSRRVRKNNQQLADALAEQERDDT